MPPVQPPALAGCTNTNCWVEKHHLAKVFNIGDRDLPRIVVTKHASLEEALAAGDLGSAHGAKQFLERFYSVHGSADGSALMALPEVPSKCKNKQKCGVKAYHINKTYAIDAIDLPRIVTEKKRFLQEALTRGHYAIARNNRKFLERFFTCHGPADGSSLTALPSLPEMCKEKLCPIKAEHAKKSYKEDSKDLPREVKELVAYTYKLYYRFQDWKSSDEQKILNEFWALHK